MCVWLPVVLRQLFVKSLTSSRFHDDDDDITHIAANRELSSDQITICLKAQESEQERKIVANIVDILLRIDQFIKSRDTISCKETMLYPLISKKIFTK